MSFLTLLYDAHVDIAGHPIGWREIVGNAFGVAFAIGGVRRRVWAWPVGNVLLFSVFIVYGVLVAYGFVVWLKASREEPSDERAEKVMA